MGTGHHTAVAAKAGPGKIAAVIGDGAVGLCGVIAAKQRGAEQIIIMGHHPKRIALAKELGATDVVTERGEEAVQRIHELTLRGKRILPDDPSSCPARFALAECIRGMALVVVWRRSTQPKRGVRRG